MPDFILKDENRKKLDGIVSQMVANKESDSDIQLVVDDFKSKYGEKKNPIQNDLTSGTPTSGTGFAPSQIQDDTKPTPYVKPKVKPKTISEAVEDDNNYLGAMYNNLIGAGTDFIGGMTRLIAKSNPYGNPIMKATADVLGNKAEQVAEKLRSGSSSKKYEEGVMQGFDLTKGVFTKENAKALPLMISRFAGDMGLAIPTAGASYLAQGYSQGLKEFDKAVGNRTTDDPVGLDNTRELFAIAYSTISSVADRYSLGFMAKSNPVAKKVKESILKETVKELATKATGKITADVIEETASRIAKKGINKFKSVGLKGLASAGVEGGTEGITGFLTDFSKLITNDITNQNIFNKEEVVEDFWKNRLNEFAGGAVLGGITGSALRGMKSVDDMVAERVSSATNKENLYEIASELKQELSDRYNDGSLDADRWNEIGTNLTNYIKATESIPFDIGAKKRKEAIQAIVERDRVVEAIKFKQEQMSAYDESLAPQAQQEIDILEAKKQSLNDNIVEATADEKFKYSKDTEKDKWYKQLGEDGELGEISKQQYELETQSVPKEKAQEVPPLEKPTFDTEEQIIAEGKKSNKIAEIESILSNDDAVFAETGNRPLLSEARAELKAELEKLRQEQGASKNTTPNAVVGQPKSKEDAKKADYTKRIEKRIANASEEKNPVNKALILYDALNSATRVDTGQKESVQELLNAHLAESGLKIENVEIGTKYNETNTSLDATIAGVGFENLKVIEVLSPIIRDANGVIVKRGKVIVESSDNKQSPTQEVDTTPEALTKAETDLETLKQVSDKVRKYDASLKRLTEAKNAGTITENEFNDMKSRFDDVMGSSAPTVPTQESAVELLKDDKSGEPITVYHGTSEDFDTFSEEQLGNFTGAESARKGFFFTDSENVANTYRRAGVIGKPNVEGIKKGLEQLPLDQQEALYRQVMSDYDAFDREDPSQSVKELLDKINEDTERGIADKNYAVEKVSKILADNGVDVEPYLTKGKTHKVKLKSKNPKIVDAGGMDSVEFDINKAIDAAKAEGHDAIIVKNLSDEYVLNEKGANLDPSNIYVVFDKNQIVTKLNPQENAIQEQTTNEIPLQPETAVSAEVAEGVPGAELEVVTGQSETLPQGEGEIAGSSVIAEIPNYGKTVDTKIGKVDLVIEPNTESENKNSIKVSAYDVNGNTLGFSSAVINPEDKTLTVKVAQIKDEYQRNGIYSKIIDEYENIAKGKGLKLKREVDGETQASKNFWSNREQPSSPLSQGEGEIDFTAKGGNKVVDEKGEPIVVLHGSPDKNFNGDFDVNKRGTGSIGGEQRGEGYFFTTDKSLANDFARKFEEDEGNQGKVGEFQIKMSNPLVVDAEGSSWVNVFPEAIDKAKAGGHDGLIVKNVIEGSHPLGGYSRKPVDEYVVFDKSQIRQFTAQESPLSQAFDLIEQAKRTKKTEKGKMEVGELAVTNLGDVGKKAIFIDNNFKDIVSKIRTLKDQKGEPFVKIDCT